MLKSNFKKQEGQESADNNEESNIPTASNSVGTGKARKLVNLVILVLSCGLVFYFLFFQGEGEKAVKYDPKDTQLDLEKELENSPPPEDPNFNDIDAASLERPFNKALERPTIPELPELPELPSIPDVALEKKEPPLEAKNNDKVVTLELPQMNASDDSSAASGQDSVQQVDRNPRKTPIMPSDMQLTRGSSFGDESGIRDLSGNAIQQAITPTPTTVTQNKDLSSIVAQGKMMTAILETAINTEVPGNIRGIVNRDVYAEAGNNILIPKGTRLFGSYSSNIARGQARVEINWSRIIRPDGLDVSISLSASDQYGRSGISGEVDNQYTSTIANALLTSVLAVGGALSADALNGGNSSTTTGSDGSVISTNTASAQVVTQVTGAIIDTVTEMISDSINIQPVIRIPHGTKMTVIVNSDITLPPYEY
jgi:type IV secretion system protein VirB10